MMGYRVKAKGRYLRLAILPAVAIMRKHQAIAIDVQGVDRWHEAPSCNNPRSFTVRSAMNATPALLSFL